MSEAKLMKLGERYLQSLKHYETALQKDVSAAPQLEAAMILSDAKVRLLEAAVNASHVIIEQLALFAAGLHALDVAQQKQIDGMSVTHPELMKQLEPHLEGLIGLNKLFANLHADECEFVLQFSKMVRDRLGVSAGVDPNNPEAMMQHLLTLGMKQVAEGEKPAAGTN